jgi:hypothetical protein
MNLSYGNICRKNRQKKPTFSSYHSYGVHPRGRKFSDLTLCPCPNVVCKFFNFFGFLHQRQREHL